MPRSLLYALIPLGFVIMVVVMVLGGWWTGETADTTKTVPSAVEQVD